MSKTAEKTEATTDKKSKIADRIIDLAIKSLETMTIDNETGVGEQSGNFVLENLPESIPLAVAEEFVDYVQTIAAAQTKAFGKLAADAAKANPNLENMSIEVPFSIGGKQSIGIKRQDTFNFGKDKPEVVKAGVSTVRFTTISNNSGQMGHVRAEINDAFAAFVLNK